MEFTSSDRVALLKCYGAVEGDTVSTTRAARQLADDLRQLEDAADVTTYELCDEDCRNVIGRISRKEAIRRLGRDGWLFGLVRSAFHRTAVRETADGKNYVMFDSSKLFR